MEGEDSSDSVPSGGETAPLPEGRLVGRLAFADAVRAACAVAAQEGWSSIVLADDDFSDWPLGERAVIEAHAVSQASPHEIPAVIWTPTWTLERLDPVRSSAVAERSAERRVALAERLDDWWAKGRPAFAPTTLGL